MACSQFPNEKISAPWGHYALKRKKKNEQKYTIYANKTGRPTTGQSIDARLQASTLFHRLAD